MHRGEMNAAFAGCGMLVALVGGVVIIALLIALAQCPNTADIVGTVKHVLTAMARIITNGT